jgi:hypothetical protein
MYQSVVIYTLSHFCGDFFRIGIDCVGTRYELLNCFQILLLLFVLRYALIINIRFFVC